MDKELLNELIKETRMEDISDRYLNIVEIIGIQKFVELSDYAKGNEIYLPKAEKVVIPARNRRIKKEFDGFNEKELAERYGLTVPQIYNILKDAPPVGQISMEEWINGLN